MVSEKIFENTHTHTHAFLHTRTQQLRVVPDEKIWSGGGGFGGKALYFCGAGDGGGGEGEWVALLLFIYIYCCCCFFVLFFQSSGQLAFVKIYNFLPVMVLLKNAVCSYGISWNEKKVPIFRRGLSRKNELCECHGGGVD